MILGFLIAALFARYLKRLLRTADTSPEWDRNLQYILVTSIVLAVASVIIKQSHPILVWVSHSLLIYIVYLLFTNKQFAAARSYIFTLTPYIVTSFVHDFIKLAFPTFFQDWKNYLETGVLFAVLWLVASLLLNRRQQQALKKEQLRTAHEEEQNKIIQGRKAELELQVAERTAEITKQKEALEVTLEELKATQSQLIQSEKMASLGELTAGIAHEIQNPLNFVNNFSEVSSELLDEMNAEMEKGDLDEAIAIAKDIKQNLEKITFHGKRADAIVKGMLQHSRSSTGQKEPTDINKLADEYFRLAYHGLRAKDKSFNATLKTDYDPTIGNVQLITQDIGRVVLNLITNAFYATADKKKAAQLSGSAAPYEPTVTVTTKKLPDAVQIKVSDNGNGIPPTIVSKIFQPFFTTKPTGQGTGLGLSMSYDIVTKGHGGTLEVQTSEGKGATFIITLPITISNPITLPISIITQ